MSCSALSGLKPIPKGAKFDPHWLEVGTKVELEHTTNRATARRIAQHHLYYEHPLYYQELLKLEKRLKSTPKPALANFDSQGWTLWYTLSVASAGICAYHGYMRTGSVGWTAAWAGLGALFPVVTPAVAFAQGFGKPIAR